MPIHIRLVGALSFLAVMAGTTLAQAGAWRDGSADRMPVAHGHRSVTQQVGLKGARLVLRKRFSVQVPPGLRIGRQSITLSWVSKRTKGALVAPGFAPIGPAVIFDRAIDATERPLVVDYKPGQLRWRKGQRFVLAVEKPVFCEQAPEGAPSLGNGLCAGWELIPATRIPRGLRAKLRLPGGMRLQFGAVPR